MGGASSVGSAKPGAILTRVRIPDAARDFSPSQLPVQTLFTVMGSAALAAAVPCPGKATRIFQKGQ